MKQPIVYAVAAALALTLAGSAQAEPKRLAQGAPGVLPPYEVLTILRSTGLNPIDRPTRRGATYVLRAIDSGGEEVRVVMDAYHGDVLSVTPTMSASRAVPPRGRLGPYEADEMEPLPPPGIYRSGPPVVYEEEPPPIYRPPGYIPGPPARSSSAPPVSAPPTASAAPPSDPQVITAPEPGENGLLPPPPERFPQRAAPPATKPAPPPRRAASAAPAKPPLPKPRPASAAPDADAAPLPPPVPDAKPAADVPH